MLAEKLENLFYQKIPGSIVHVKQHGENCFEVNALYPARNRKDAHSKIGSIVLDADFEILALSLMWHGSETQCEFNPWDRKPSNFGLQYLESHSWTSNSYEDDDDCDYESSPNWPSKTGNPSGGGRDNNPPRR